MLASGGLAFGGPVPVMAGGRAINVEVGHAAPAWSDLTGDGVPDLIVGQFGEGKARVYKNYGSAANPAFRDFTFLQAGGQTATVDYG